MRPLDYGFEYKGWRYYPWEDLDPERSHIFHNVTHDSLEENNHFMPISSYDVPTEESFKAWIELGMPDRTTVNTAVGKSDMSPPKNIDIVEMYMNRMLLDE